MAKFSAQSALRTVATGIAVIALGVLLTVVLLRVARPFFAERLRPALLGYLAANLDEGERRALYDELARESGTLWDVAPDALVGRLAKRRGDFRYRGASVHTNNAGLRSARPYRAKPPDVFRVVCLGDSFVFGEGGAERDRFCDQVEAFYSAAQVRVDGRRVETYALGLPSWTLLQEARYLARRLTAYDPDVIVVMTTANDITDSFGVTGHGTLTTAFSEEHRDWGSAVFSNQQALRLGSAAPTALTTDVSPEARARWRRGMEQLAELVRLQQQRGGHVLLELLLYYADGYFVHTYLDQLARAGVRAPLLMTDFFSSPATRLAHDAHPNRAGHAILAHHVIHALSALGWVSVPPERLPPLDERLSLEFEHPPNPEALARQRAYFVETRLHPELDFRHLTAEEAVAILGGLLPSKRSLAEGNGIWASVRSAFLLRRAQGAREVEVEIEVPRRPELLPLEIRLSLDGVPSGVRTIDADQAGTSQKLRAPLPPPEEADAGAVEVLLEASSHFARIGDATMRSFRLLSARVR